MPGTVPRHIFCCCWCAAFVISATLTATLAAQADTQPSSTRLSGLHVALEPGGKDASIVAIRAPAEATAASRQIYLRGLSGQEWATVRLSCSLQPSSPTTDSSAARPVATVGLTANPPPSDIEPDQWMAATVNVANLSVMGSFSGPIVAERGGEVVTLAQLSVERYPVPSLRVVGSKLPGGIALTAYESKFQFTVQIVSENAAAVRDLRVVIGHFVGGDTGLVVPTVTKDDKPLVGTELEVPGFGTIELKIAADLQAQGTYSSEIVLLYSGRAVSVPLVVTRARLPVTVDIVGLQPVQQDRIFPADVTFRFRLRETANRQVVLRPTVDGFAVRGTGNAKSQAEFLSQSLVREREPSKPVTDVLTLQPGESDTFLLTLKGVSGVGEMTGTLNLGQGASGPVQQELTASLRYGWLIAALCIGFGVTVSWLLRLFFTKVQPKFNVQRRLSRQLQQVRQLPTMLGVLNPRELAAQRALSQRIIEKYNELETADATPTSAETLVVEVNQKLTAFTAWVNARRSVEALHPESLRPPFQEALDKTAAYLAKPNTTEQEFSAAQGQLLGIPELINKSMRDALGESIKQFGDALRARYGGTAPDALARALETTVIPPLNDAMALLSQDDFDAARQKLRAAKTAYAGALVADFDASIPSAAPVGIAPDKWTQMVARLRAALKGVSESARSTPDLAVERYSAVYTAYFESLGLALRDVVERDKEKYAHVIAVLDQLQQAMQAKRSAEFSETYNKALERYDAARAEEHVTAFQADGADAVNPPRTRDRSAVASEIVPEQADHERTPERPLEDLPSLEQQSEREWNYLVFVALAIAGIAILSGLKLLWVNNLTWGSRDDIMIAILWGLGLHQVGTVAFDISTLADRFRGVKPN